MKKFLLLLSILISTNIIFAQDYQDRIIAIVNNKVILKSEVQEAISNLSTEEVTKEFSTLNEDQVVERIINRLIDDNLLLQAADRFGITISDIALEKKVSEIAKSKNLTINEFRNLIVSNGQNYEKYIIKIKNQMTIEALFLTQFYSRMNVTEEEVENFIKREKINEDGDINYDLIEFVIVDEEKTLSQKVVEQVYQSAIKVGFQKTKNIYNEYNINIRNMGVVNIDRLPNIFVAALKEKINESYTQIIKSSKGYHILKILSSTNKASTFIDEYKVRHILLVSDIMTTDKEVKDRLYKMRNEITDIDDFAESAKKYSADKTSGFKGGDLNWVRSKSLVPEFAKVMENMPLNKISDPFKTQFGWHILYVENKRTIDDAKAIIKNNIANAIRVNKAKRERDDWMAKLKEQAFIEIKEF